MSSAVFFICFPLLCLVQVAQTNNCRLLINEINADTPEEKESLEFVELKAFDCASRLVDLTGYRILFVKGLGTSKKPEIEGVISLPRGSQLLRNGYFVAGDPAISPPPDLAFSGEKALLRQKFYTKSGSILKHFAVANGNVVPHAIILLKIPGNQVMGIQSKLQIGPNKQFIPLDPIMTTLLQEFIVDMVVYSRRSGFTKCSIFEYLVPTLAGTNYVLREWNPKKDGIPDESLNRCTDNKLAFQHIYFKTGKPSPGADNNCDGTRFLLSQHMQANFPEDPTAIPHIDEPIADEIQGPEESCASDHLPVSRSQIVRMTDEAYIQMKKKEVEASCSHDAPEEIAMVSADVEASSSRKRSMLAEIDLSGPDVSPEKAAKLKESAEKPNWEETKFFKDEWVTFLREKMADKFDINWLNKDQCGLKKWLEIVPNQANPADTIFRCRVCNEHYDKYMDARNKPLLATPEGVRLTHTVKHKNKEKLTEHVFRIGKKCRDGAGSQAVRTGGTKHQQLIAALNNGLQPKLSSQVQKLDVQISETVGEGKFHATANMMRLVYAECLLNVPFFPILS